MVDTKLRIGFFSGPVDLPGSSQMIVLPLARALYRQGHSVFAMKPTNFAKDIEEYQGIQIVSMPILPLIWKRPSIVFDYIKYLMLNNRFYNSKFEQGLHVYYLSVLARLQMDFVKNYQLDVLYTFHNFFVAGPLQLERESSFLYCINLIGFGIDKVRGGAWDTFPIQRIIFEKPAWDLHITSTSFEYEQYHEVYKNLNLDSNRLINLPHSVDESVFCMIDRDELVEFRDKLNVPSSFKILLYPVAVYRRKNIELSIEVISQIKQLSVLIITGPIWDEDYYGELKSLAEELGVGQRVIFLQGSVAFSDMPKIYNIADVTVFTSHQETFGMGLVESLACGTPVVGPGWINACNAIMNGQIGAYPAKKDVGDVANIIEQVLSLDSSRCEISKSAHEKYGSVNIAAEFVRHVNDIRYLKSEAEKKLNDIDWRKMYDDDVDIFR